MLVSEILERRTVVENAIPNKVDPVLEPFPQMPEKPAQPYTTDDGETVKPTRNGGVSLGNAAGTFIWDKNGQPSMYITPSINGLKQVHNIKKKTFVVNYSNQGFDIKATYDQQGNKISDDSDSTSYSMGGASVKQEGSVMSFAYTFADAFSMEAKIDTAKVSPEQAQTAKSLAQKINGSNMKDIDDLVTTVSSMGGEVTFKNNGRVIPQQQGLQIARQMFS